MDDDRSKQVLSSPEVGFQQEASPASSRTESEQAVVSLLTPQGPQGLDQVPELLLLFALKSHGSGFQHLEQVIPRQPASGLPPEPLFKWLEWGPGR